MTLPEWNLERQRAWTAIYVGRYVEYPSAVIAGEVADQAMEEWEKRFPKPEEPM